MRAGGPVGTRGFPVLSLCLALALSGCQGEAGSRPPRAGDPLPPLQAVTLAGDTVALDAYRGKGLLLNVWATWCPPCRAEMPYLDEIAERYAGRGLAVVGLSVDDAGARPLLEDFLTEVDISYDILLDPEMVTMDRLGILGLPATFLVDPQGVVRVVRAGPILEGDQAFLDAVEGILP